VRGEREYPVAPLDLPDPARAPTAAAVALAPAAELFVRRVREVGPDFAPTDANAPAIAAICRRLDGLPLAIELAAARGKFLSPEALLARLERSLAVLVGGPRDLPARQQTLRASIAWSYDLLPAAERALFRRLAVFRGGASLEAAEAVCRAAGALPVDLLDGLASLADKSLARPAEADGEPRVLLLETIREFGLERLEETGEAEATRAAHARFFAGLAEATRPKLTGPDHRRWLDRLEREHDNFRAAFAWLRARREAESGLRLGRALSRFWFLRCHLTEGRAQLEAFLGLPGAAAGTPARARALQALAQLVYRQGDYAAARAALEEALAIARALGDRPGAAAALREIGRIAMDQGAYAAAAAPLQDSLTIQRALRDDYGTAWALNQLGQLAFFQGDLPAAEARLTECLALFRALDDRWGLGTTLFFLGRTACSRGDFAAARAHLVASLDTVVTGLPWAMAFALEDFARLAAAQGRAERALRLAGAAEAARAAIDSPLAPAWAAEYERRRPPPGARSTRRPPRPPGRPGSGCPRTRR
jgi:predicted ATPase